uniref:Polymorphic toxin-type HINT domain-containing protein n=1 Tax=Streptomyces sp. NBC_01401 TaxID=2903854 RepID=A0AAU3GNM5_9ACTN
MKSRTDHYFLRGMDGDKAGPDGGSKTVTVSDGNGGTITDHDTAAGFEYRTESYSGPDGVVLGKTVSTPWHHETAKRVRSWGTTTANLTGTASERTWTSLDEGKGAKWMVTSKTNTFEETLGRPVRTEDRGDESTGDDDQCTRTTYVDNTTDWILDSPSRVETVAGACGAEPNRSKDVIADVRTAYDGQAYGKAPTKGDVTHTADLTSHDGTTATYLESQATYDAYGRQLTDTDISATVKASETAAPVRTARTDGRTTTTVYTPATGLPTSSTVTTPPATAGDNTTAETTTTTYDAARGLPTVLVDTNNKRTDTTYDALGRNSTVWLPNHPKASGGVPSFQFTYTNDGKGPIAVGTRTIKNDGKQATSYTLLDGFLRTRQTQSPGPSGGRLLTDTFYDERGLAAKQFAAYYDTDAPSTSLSVVDNALAVESQTWNTYDGLGRVVKTQDIAGNGLDKTVLATTVTSYEGDRVSVTPPEGGTPTTTVSDARGNTTALLQYHGDTPTGTADTTHYAYTPAGKLAKVTDPSGSEWSYTYDQAGNQTGADDPDQGASTTAYDDRGQVISTKNARGQVITHVHDGLGRETETHDGDASGPLLTKKVWDPTGFKGQLSSSTRYVGGADGSAYTTTYSMYDTLYRPNRTTVTVPSVAGEEALAGAYQTNVKYNLDGTLASSSYPKAGSLSSDVVTPTYDEVQRPVTLSGTNDVSYVTDTAYSFTGKPLQYTYRSGGKKTQVTNTYEWGTQRLSTSRVNREDVTGTDKAATYGYDDAGNILSISDVSRAGTDNQCFQYDYLGRMEQAWAQGTANCASTPSSSVLGGPAPYWQSFTYDTSGNRTSETQHDASGDASRDIEHTYTYPEPDGAQPHTLTKVDTTGPTGTTTDSYTYDASGNTETRTLGGDKQTLTWDPEGHLAEVGKPDGNGGTKSTSYVYDADGNRLLQRTDAGTTLYLGSTEITLSKDSDKPKATRYYDLGGGTEAVRTDDNQLSFLVGDQNGTSELAIDAADQTEQQRRSTPFGDPRGSQPDSWPGSKGFVGGTQDTTTGLTHLGAREYDPSLGRFLSADPVLDIADPQQMNGYAYGNSNPVTHSDPTGLCPADLCGNGYPIGGTGTSPDNPTRFVTTGPKNLGSTRYGVPSYSAPSYSPAVNKKVSKAQKVLSTPVIQVAKKVGWELFKDYIGWNDVKGCISGSVGSCATLLINAIPWTAVFSKGAQLIKAAWKITKALRKWNKERKWARDVMEAADRAAESPASCIVPHSFLPGTEVLLADGTTKKIEDVKTGDVVLVTDPNTGKTTTRKVVGTIVTQDDKDFTSLTLATPDGRSHLTATDTHPFWVPELNNWITAGALKPGMFLRTSSGTHVQIAAVAHYTKRQRTHDLTVDDVHTYYVLAGATPVLVHNCNGVSIYRTPKVDDMAHELERGPNPASHQDGDASVYLGEKSVAKEYQNRGSYANGSIRYDMHEDFLKEFSDTAFRYDRKGPGGSARIEFVIPVGRLDRFNELTLRRVWGPGNG